jgi:hypothetical protein
MTGVARAGNLIATAGALIFIFVLFVAAYWEPDIRWLHFYQSWMYLATVILAWRKNKWGYFVGIGVSGILGLHQFVCDHLPKEWVRSNLDLYAHGTSSAS